MLIQYKSNTLKVYLGSLQNSNKHNFMGGFPKLYWIYKYFPNMLQKKLHVLIKSYNLNFECRYICIWQGCEIGVLQMELNS